MLKEFISYLPSIGFMCLMTYSFTQGDLLDTVFFGFMMLSQQIFKMEREITK